MRAPTLAAAVLAVACTPALPRPPPRTAPPVVALAPAPQVPAASVAALSPRAFVERRGRCLVRDGHRLRLVGSSAFHLQEEAVRAASGQRPAAEHFRATFDAAEHAGLTVLRVSGFNDGPRDTAIQPTRGVFSERGFAGLDAVVAEAGRRGLLLIVVLSNYWDEYGGVAQHLRWRGLPERERHRVYVEPGLLDDMQSYAARLAQRVNTVTGVRYADDPTIMAWEVMNEPRGDGLADDGEAMARFLVRVAEELHRVAPRQLVLAGDEGFDARTAGYDAAYWQRIVSAPLLGPRQHQSFQLLARDPAIDAATLHFYPDWWGVRHGAEPEAGVRWIHEHAQIARDAGKPLLFDEFGALDRVSQGRGLLPEERVAAYEAWFAAARAEHNVAAVMPWGLSYDGRTSSTDGFEWGAPSAEADLLRPAIARWAGLFAAEQDASGCE